MKRFFIALAYESIWEMLREDWEYELIYPLLGLMAELQPDYVSYRSEELSILADLSCAITAGDVSFGEDGTLCLSSFAHCPDFPERVQKLLHSEGKEIEVKLTLPDAEGLKERWRSSLSPFCRFEKGGEKHGKTA